MDPYWGNVLAWGRCYREPQTFSVFVVLAKLMATMSFRRARLTSHWPLSLPLTPSIRLSTCMYELPLRSVPLFPPTCPQLVWAAAPLWHRGPTFHPNSALSIRHRAAEWRGTHVTPRLNSAVSARRVLGGRTVLWSASDPCSSLRLSPSHSEGLAWRKRRPKPRCAAVGTLCVQTFPGGGVRTRMWRETHHLSGSLQSGCSVFPLYLQNKSENTTIQCWFEKKKMNFDFYVQ